METKGQKNIVTEGQTHRDTGSERELKQASRHIDRGKRHTKTDR